MLQSAAWGPEWKIPLIGNLGVNFDSKLSFATHVSMTAICMEIPLALKFSNLVKRKSPERINHQSSYKPNSREYDEHGVTQATEFAVFGQLCSLSKQRLQVINFTKQVIITCILSNNIIIA